MMLEPTPKIADTVARVLKDYGVRFAFGLPAAILIDLYVAMLTRWGTTTDFWSNFRRISEVGNVVFLELEEHNTPRGGEESVVNSLSLYEFDEGGKMVHLDIYLQMAPPPGMAMDWN